MYAVLLILLHIMWDHGVQLGAQVILEERGKKKIAAAVGSRQRCTAAENSQDADASKRFRTDAPLSVHWPCSALQMSSLNAGKCNTSFHKECKKRSSTSMSD